MASVRPSRLQVSRSARHVVALRGGRGNQLFQFAFARWLAVRSGREVAFDISSHRDLNIELLAVPVVGERVRSELRTRTRLWPALGGRLARTAAAVRSANGPRAIRCDESAWGSASPDTRTPAWWHGYFQREEYASVVAGELAFALGSAATPEEPRIGVHVRRGDMVGKSTEVPASWFKDTVREAYAGTTVRPCVWSDDASWCRERLDLGVDFDVADDGTALEHLTGLSRCDVLVISRSTFSWWAARLASDRGGRVLFPSPWWDGAASGYDSAVPRGWTPVPVYPQGERRPIDERNAGRTMTRVMP
jgi:hypothetical protein